MKLEYIRRFWLEQFHFYEAVVCFEYVRKTLFIIRRASTVYTSNAQNDLNKIQIGRI